MTLQVRFTPLQIFGKDFKNSFRINQQRNNFPQPVVIYDVPLVEAAGKNPIVPVIALERLAENLTIGDAVTSGAEVTGSDTLFTING